MTDENASLPPAGWYPDPEVAGGERWWDGTAWSTHQRAATVAPEPPVAPPAPVAPAAPEASAVPAAPEAPAYAYAPSQAPAASPYVAPPASGYGTSAPGYGVGYGTGQPSNVTALVGLILSIVGVALGWLLTFLSLAALAGLIVSIIGLRTASRMRAEGNPNHRWGLALAGVIVGGAGILVGAILVVAWIVYFVQYMSYY